MNASPFPDRDSRESPAPPNETDSELLRLNRALRVMTGCSPALARAQDEAVLLRQVCQTICEAGGYRLAWVGYAEQDAARSVTVAAYYGSEAADFANIRVSWADTERGRGPTGRAIRTGQTVICADIAVDPCVAPWQAQAARNGVRSSISLPLAPSPGQAALGALAICSAETGAFGAEEVRLLERLASDLAFGIQALRTRAERDQAYEALRKNRDRLERVIECLLGFGEDRYDNLNRLTALCGELLGATCALFNRVQGGMLCALGRWQAPPGFQAESSPEGHICYDVIRANRDDAVLIRNLPATLYGQTDPNVGAFGLQTYLGRVVRCGGVPVGALCAVFREDFEPGDDDFRLLRLIASALGNEDRRRQALEQLQDSKALYRSLVESLPQNIFRKDLDGRFTFANQRFCQSLGRALEEVVGRTDEELFPAHLAAKYRQDDRRVIATGTIFETTEAHLAAGRPSHVQVVKTPLQDAQGQIVGVQGIFWDITKAREDEEALRRSQAALQSVFQAAPIGIGVLCNRVFCQVNDRFCAMTGYAREELLGQSARLLYPCEEDYDYVGREKYRQIAERGVGTVETRWRRKDGRILEVLLSSSPLDRADLAKGVTFTAVDITQTKRAEEALRQSRADLERAQAVGHVGSWISDPEDSGRLAWSAETCRIFGLEEAGFDGQVETFWSLVHPADLPAVKAASEAARRGEKPYDLEHRIVRPDGAGRWVHEKAEVERAPSGKPGRMVGVVQDITERRLLEEQLRQSQKLESIGQLAAGVAHDFNNILMVIAGSATLLEERLADRPECGELLHELIEAGDRAANLTRQLLLFSRRQHMYPQSLDLNEVTANLTKMLGRMIGEDITLELSHQPGLPRVQADLGMIEQVVLNLAVNARDAMPRGGYLRLATSSVQVPPEETARNPEARAGLHVRLTVSDTGCGIPTEVLPRIFEPFFTTKEVGKGTGLGLATVYGIVRQHGGWIELRTEVGRGTAFRIHLPAIPAEPAEDGAAEPPPVPDGRGQKILLVEDERPVRELVSRVLTEHGYEVLVAHSGAEARELPEERLEGLALLVTDLVMPGGVSGQELAEALRRRLPDLPVVFCSGYSIEAARLDPSRGDVFLQKPFSLRQLLEAVAAGLRS